MGPLLRRKSHLLLLVAVVLVSCPGKRAHLVSEARREWLYCYIIAIILVMTTEITDSALL